MDSPGQVVGRLRGNFSVGFKGSQSLKALLDKRCDVSTCFFGKEKRLGNYSVRETYKDMSKCFLG